MLVGQALEDLGALGKAARNRQLADIAADAQQPARVDDRTDIVQHAPLMTAGRAVASAMMRSPPREVPMKTARSVPLATKHLHQVVELDADVVVLPVAVVLGEAAPAIVERQHPPRLRLVCAKASATSWKSAAVRASPGRQTMGDRGEASGP